MEMIVKCRYLRDVFMNVLGKSEQKREMKLKAMQTLAPRNQPAGNECSVTSCLNQFTAGELLTGNNKFGCERCTRRKYNNQDSEGRLLSPWSPLHGETGKMAQKNPCQGKYKVFGNFAKKKTMENIGNYVCTSCKFSDLSFSKSI